jgi:hypothetical protein
LRHRTSVSAAASGTPKQRIIRGMTKGPTAIPPSLNIKNAETCRLIHELAELTGESMTSAVTAAVREQLLKARSDHSLGLPVAIDRQTVAQFLEHWREHSLKPSAKPRSYESFSTIIEKHITPELGRVRLDKLNPQQVQALLNRKLKADLSGQTVVNIRTVLRSALSQALKWGLVARNAAALVDPPRIVRPKAYAPRRGSACAA